MPSGGGGGACRGHTNTNCTIEDTDDSFRWRRHSSSAQRRREAGLLDQSQQWANRNEDGGTGALPSFWRKGRCETRRLLPDWSQRLNHLEHGASDSREGCRIIPYLRVCTQLGRIASSAW